MSVGVLFLSRLSFVVIPAPTLCDQISCSYGMVEQLCIDDRPDSFRNPNDTLLCVGWGLLRVPNFIRDP